MSGDFSAAMLIPLLISGCGISLTAIVILLYHFLIVQYCLGRQNRLRADTTLGFNNSDSVQANKLGIDSSALALIPTIQFSAQMFNDMLKGDQSECAICLADLEEGVTVRVLPNCHHAFHVRCIDQWLSSHVNCPFCRSEIFPFVFSEWIMEFEGGDDVEARRSSRYVPVYRSKNNIPGSGLGFIRKNINPMEKTNNTNTINNDDDAIINTPSSSASNVIDETSHIEINVAENENNKNNNNNNPSASSSTSFSSCSSSNGSMDMMSEDTTSSQFDKMSMRLIRSLSQLRVAAGWSGSSSTVGGGANSDSPC